MSITCSKCNKPNRNEAIYCKWCGSCVISKSAEPLKELVGLDDIKAQLRKIINTCEALQARSRHSGVSFRMDLNIIITGNTGTGKTKLAQVIHKLLYAAGIVKKELTIVDAVDYSSYFDASVWDENIEKLKDGILCIENAQKLLPTGKSDSISQLDKLFSSMPKWMGKPIVILSGLPDLQKFMLANPDVRNRFQYQFDLKDYTVEDVVAICEKILKDDYRIALSPEAQEKLDRVFKYEKRNCGENFGNGHLAAQKAYNILLCLSERDTTSKNPVAIPEDIPGKEFRPKTYEEVMAELDEFVGVDEIRETVQKIVNKMDMDRERNGAGAKREIKDHFLFLGNPGTGKTTIARVFADVLNALDVLPVGQLVEVSRKDLVSNYVGQTAKEVEAAFDRAMGGVLFIDEAYSLIQGDNDNFGKEAVDTMLKLAEDNRGKIVVILAGYTKEMNDFLSTNSGLTSRFNEVVNFRDYTAEELTEIFYRLVKKGGFTIAADADEHVRYYFQKMYRARTRNFGNAREVRNTYDDAVKNQSKRLQAIRNTPQYDQSMLYVLTREDIGGPEASKVKTVEEIMAELDEFVGVDEIRETVRKMIDKIEMDRERNGADAKREIKDHFLFLGNPGTGKTTIARVFANILNALEVLPSGQLVEVSRNDLIGAYQGHTVRAVKEAFDRAMGGILFIDEAYSLISDERDMYGKEAVDTILKLAEDNRGKIVVILAGYTKEMGEFLSTNSGLASRFNETVNFRDYTAEELTEIFRRMVKKGGFTLDADADERVVHYFQKMYLTRTRNFGNAREVRNTYDNAVKNQAKRLQTIKNTPQYDASMLYVLTREDIEGAEATKEKSIDDIMKELDEFVGMDSVKKEIRSIANKILLNRRMMEMGLAGAEAPTVHLVITGNPGTGKTTIARKMGEIFKAIGLLPSDKVVQRERKSLLSSYIEDTAINVDKACDEAMGGILFIDEAYNLMPFDAGGSRDQNGAKAVDALMTRMSNDAGKFVVILAGYRAEMEEFINNANPGLKRRFTHFLHIEDYTADELHTIYNQLAAKKNYKFTPEAEELVAKCIDEMVSAKDEKFGNAGEMVKLFERTRSRQSDRLVAHMNENMTPDMYLTIEASDIPYDPPKKVDVNECLAELNNLIGLDSVKDEVRGIADYINIERGKAEALGKKFEGISDHYLFIGNPGTGKTTVARIMGNIFYSLGMLPSNKVVDVTAKDLIAGYIGQTGKQTEQVVKRAIGGVLFIDEAYSLDDGPHGFGKDATATLLRMLLDYKGKMICIAAGYPYEMQKWLDTNSGLTSRFNKTIIFEDYNAEQLSEIFLNKAKKDHLTLDAEAEQAMRSYFDTLCRNKGRNFGNAREVNNYFAKVKINQSARLRKAMERPDFDKMMFCQLLAEDMLI